MYLKTQGMLCYFFSSHACLNHQTCANEPFIFNVNFITGKQRIKQLELANGTCKGEITLKLYLDMPTLPKEFD